MSVSPALDAPRVAAPARPWLVVLGSALALSVGNGPIILFTFGVLVGPIDAEFGWPRATLASAIVAAHTAGALAMPFIGALIDRFGIRRVTLPAICAFALIFGGLAALPANPLFFVLGYALLGVVGAGHSTLPYAHAVSSWFGRKRGLALGLTLSGVGLGGALVPQIARLLVAHVGWRGAYVGVASILFLVAAPAVVLFVRDRGRDASGGDAEADVASGTTLRDALGSFQFWAIGVALFLVAMAVNGSIAHIVPLLADRGVSAEAATTALSASGLALILGRILSGHCLDRFFAPVVAVVFFLVPFCGLVVLGTTAGAVPALAAATLLGIGIGAEVDIMAFLVSRYFGLAHYGAIYGTLLALFTFGTGLGPWLIALAFDHFHAYGVAFTGAGLALAAASVLVLRLGPYKYA